MPARGRPKGFGIAGMMAQPDPAETQTALAGGVMGSGGPAAAPAANPCAGAGELLGSKPSPAVVKAMAERQLRFVERDGVRVEVGKGAFATAYLALDSKDNELVIKEVDLPKLGPRDRMKAGQEVLFLKGFTHVSVIRCTDSFNSYNMLHIVLEYASQGTLQHRIENAKKESKPFPGDQVCKWFAEMAAGLEHLHAARVLHRDLKTANIFLDKELRVKLGDFGMSRKLDDDDNLSGGQVGTPYYFAPEVCKKHPYSNKTDIWGSGVVLYEMGVLKRPFDAKSMKGLLKAIQEAKYAPVPDATDPRVARQIAGILVVSQRDRPSATGLCKHPDLAPFVPACPAAASPPVRRVPAKSRDPSKRSAAVRKWVLGVAGHASSNHPQPRRQSVEREAEAAPAAAASPERAPGGAADAGDDGGYDDDFESPARGETPGAGADDDADEDEFFEDDYEDDFDDDVEVGGEEAQLIKQLTECGPSDY